MLVEVTEVHRYLVELDHDDDRVRDFVGDNDLGPSGLTEQVVKRLAREAVEYGGVDEPVSREVTDARFIDGDLLTERRVFRREVEAGHTADAVHEFLTRGDSVEDIARSLYIPPAHVERLLREELGDDVFEEYTTPEGLREKAAQADAWARSTDDEHDARNARRRATAFAQRARQLDQAGTTTTGEGVAPPEDADELRWRASTTDRDSPQAYELYMRAVQLETEPGGPDDTSAGELHDQAAGGTPPADTAHATRLAEILRERGDQHGEAAAGPVSGPPADPIAQWRERGSRVTGAGPGPTPQLGL
jgi:hypothetical protein